VANARFYVIFGDSLRRLIAELLELLLCNIHEPVEDQKAVAVFPYIVL